MYRTALGAAALAMITAATGAPRADDGVEAAYFRLVRGERAGRHHQDRPAVPPPPVPAAPDPAALAAAPLSASSTWNVPIGPGATYADVPGIGAYAVGFSAWLEPDGVSVPVYVAAPGDRSRRVLHRADSWANLFSGAWKSTGNAPGVEASILSGANPAFPFAYHTYVSLSASELVLPPTYAPILRNGDGTAPRILAPEGIRGSGNGDGHMVVFQPDGTAFESYATTVLSDGTIVCQSYQVTNPALAGDGLQNGVTASMIPVYAGLVHQSELDRGRIGHAMKVVVPASMLRTAAVYPALTFDRGATTEQPPYSGGVPMGGRLALPPGTSVASLGLTTAYGRTVGEAAKAYGFIVTDRGGGGITIVNPAGATTRWSWEVDRDLRRIMAAVRMVTVPAASYRASD